MKNTLKRFDDYLINLINIKMSHRYLDKIMFRATNLGGAIFSTLLVLILILIGSSNIKLMGFELLTTLTISQIIVHSLKMLMSRERPYNIFEHLNTFGIDLKDYSFPSGHTTAAISMATTITLNIPRLSLIVFALAVIVGISRIYLAVHYPTDVATGIIIGFSTAIIVHYFLQDFIYNLVKFMNLIID